MRSLLVICSFLIREQFVTSFNYESGLKIESFHFIKNGARIPDLGFISLLKKRGNGEARSRMKEKIYERKRKEIERARK